MNGGAVRRGARIAVACALVATSVPARVYWLRGERSHGATSAGQPGWNRAYSARLRINDGAADLEVLGVSLPAPEAERTLLEAYRAMGADAWAMHGTAIGWGIAVDGHRIVRWLMFSLGAPRECVVVRLTQSREEFLASARPPRGDPMPALPPAPAVDTTLWVADETSRAAVQLGRSALPVSAVARRLTDDLVQAGWQPATPLGPDAPPLLFRRGRELCAVLASPREEGGSTVVRLHKVLGAAERP